MFIEMISIAIGATLGAWSRWGIGKILNPLFPVFPLGTLCVNLIGCFLISFILFTTTRSIAISDTFRLLFVTGFLGSFTTFSTFSVEVIHYFIHKHFGYAVLAILLNVVGGLTLTYLGYLTFKGVFLHR